MNAPAPAPERPVIRRLLPLACAALALFTACGGPEEPVRYEDLVTSGRLAAAPGAEDTREHLCADETRFAVALEDGAELEATLLLGREPHLGISACRPSLPEATSGSAPGEAPTARLHATVRATAGLGTEIRLPVTGEGWAEGSLDLAALAGSQARLHLRVEGSGGPILVSDLWLRHRTADSPAWTPARAGPAPAADPVQILLISLDTLRADAVAGFPPSGTGGGGPDTPALAAFAEGAQVFTPHYAAASWTKPSHGSLLTGLPVEAHGANLEDQPLSPAATTLAERLRAGGLRTAGLVYDCLWLGPKFGFDRGFDEYRVMRWHADQAVRFTASWIARHRREPFFYFLHLFTPHSDMVVLPYEATGVTRDTVAERFGVEGYGCRQGSCASSLLHAIDSGDVAPLPGEGELLRFLYHRGVETTDRALGRLFDDLAETGLLDRMLVVVTSDHGEAFFEHGRLLHQTVHDEILRVPLLVRWPRGEGGGGVRTAPTSSIDLAPTLLRAAGLEAGELPGRPLQDLPEGGGRRRELFAGTVHKAVVAGPWKAIFLLTGAPSELYRLDRDPAESRNLATEHPEVLEELRERVIAHVEAARRLTEAKGAAELPGITPEERKRLEALGYVD